MDGLPLPLWGAVALAACAGSMTFALIRPNRESLLAAVAQILTGAVTGTVLAYAICEWAHFVTPHQHMFVAYVIGLLGMSLARAAVTLTETQAGKVAMGALRRALGIAPKDGDEDGKDDADEEAVRTKYKNKRAEKKRRRQERGKRPPATEPDPTPPPERGTDTPKP